MRENKNICEHYLNMISNKTGLELKLSGRNGYYCIDQELKTGACNTILCGATLAQCKEWAVSVFELMHRIEGAKQC